ncbi:MAG: hypothetical protein EZS28_035884 [Streblomastix strix]|uniref:Uncharacterized protein n=1 Tax=Streblomastix strix TaxID=222440 RepID=A0A5J4UEQ8_9EUKA|nr:MAG: hypothetical protein EZS28_035884 [Streblomastix strix]
MLFRALSGLHVAKAFLKIIHSIIGTQIDLILTPREEETKYGQEMQISAIWDSEINGGIEGGVHISEIEHAHGLENLLPNIGVGGISKIQLYNENCISKGMAQRKYILQSEKVEGREQVVVKKRALRIIPFCEPTFLGRRDAFTLESIGPEGYDTKYEENSVEDYLNDKEENFWKLAERIKSIKNLPNSQSTTYNTKTDRSENHHQIRRNSNSGLSVIITIFEPTFNAQQEQLPYQRYVNEEADSFRDEEIQKVQNADFERDPYN